MDLYSDLLKAINSAPTKKTGYFDLNKYLGTPRMVLNISAPDTRILIREFSKKYPNISWDELQNLLNKLVKGDTFNERQIVSSILACYPKYIFEVTPGVLHSWLLNLEGWCEIDCLCQNTFPPEFFLSKWDIWDKSLKQFAKDDNVSVQRASLVLLCMATRKSGSQELAGRAFENVTLLMKEKDILITKAVSWILRSLIENNKEKVSKFLEEYKDKLPKIAVREVTKKLTTGRKSG